MLTEKIRNKIIAKLPKKSDTELADEFGVSRKTIWRIRQDVKLDTSKVPAVDNPPMQTPVAKPSDIAPVVFNSLSPKVDVEPVVLGTYFSLQLLRGESYKDVAHAFLDAAEKLGALFRKLQVMDLMTVGTTTFVRFRTDLTPIEPILSVMSNRGTVSADVTGGYTVKFLGGRSGKYPTSTMCLQPKLGFGQILMGTRLKRWRQQFVSP